MAEMTTMCVVKDVREQYGQVDNPIILICDTWPIRARRRLRIPDYKDEVYSIAQMLVVGDIFTLTETILKNNQENGEIVRTIDKIEPRFRKQV